MLHINYMAFKNKYLLLGLGFELIQAGFNRFQAFILDHTDTTYTSLCAIR